MRLHGDPSLGQPADDANNHAPPAVWVSSSSIWAGLAKFLDFVWTNLSRWTTLEGHGDFVDDLEVLIFKGFKLGVKILLVVATAILAYLALRHAIHTVYLIATGGLNGVY